MPDIKRFAETGTTQPFATRLAELLVLVLISTPITLHADSVPDHDVGAWYAVPSPDQSDWSEKRLNRYATLDRSGLGQPLAVVRVPDLEVAAQVYPDVHTEALEAGAAWVSATTPPGKRGNIAIAGHRDSFFRALENIPLGTRISLTTAERELLFTVTDVEIVDPLDTSPLAPTETTTLTLITCHPFRYQGYAPDRYIIRAEILEDSQTQTEPAESALRTIPAT